MSVSDVARSERILEKIGARLGITPAGAEWLKAAADPFHDTPLNVCGYPDINEAASVVQVVRLSAPLSVPGNVTSPNTWDCHIHSFPWMMYDVGFLGAWSGSAGSIPGHGPFALGGITNNACPMGNIGVCSVPSGNNTWDSGLTIGGGDLSFPLAPELAPYLRGEYRIIAKGWEVINTSAELTVQGLVTVYRQPFPDTDSSKSILAYSSAVGSPPSTAVGYPSVVIDDFPPNTSANALLLDGSKQWKAKEGVYITDTLNSQEIPTGIDMSCIALNIPAGDSNAGTNAAMLIGTTLHTIATIPSSPTSTLLAVQPDGILPTKFNHSGAYFTGLSYTTTLQLNAIFYIERFPTQQNADLVVLAKHSCRYDSIALDLYSEIVRAMPVGVPQRMNGLGEWFADAVSSAADFVSPVLSAIPTPMTQGLAGMVKTAGNVAKTLAAKREAPSVYSANGSQQSVSKKEIKKVVQVVEAQKKKKAKAGKKK